MDLDFIKDILSSWAKNNKMIDQVVIFGSRARNNFNEDSYLDIAITLSNEIEDKLSVWIESSQKWSNEIQKLLSYKIHLEWNGGGETPTIDKAIKKSNIMVFERKNK